MVAALPVFAQGGALPYVMVADAGSGAARFSSDARYQLQYTQNYARGALDALVQGSAIAEAMAASERVCAGRGDLQVRAIECGYSGGVAAITVKRLAVTLADFGYEPASVRARVHADSDSGLRYLAAPHAKRWLLTSSPASSVLEIHACYRLAGFLGRSGALGARYERYAREFIVTDAAAIVSCGDSAQK